MRPAATTKLCARRETLAAHGHGVRAARVETAARGWVNEAGNLPTRGELFGALIGVETARIRCGGDQQLCVGMFGLLDYVVARPTFDHLTGIHYHHVLGEVARGGDIMRDEEQ